MRSADPAAAARAFVAAGSVPHDVAAEARLPLVKICGVTDSEGVLAAVRAGADAIGLNFVPGHAAVPDPRRGRVAGRAGPRRLAGRHAAPDRGRHRRRRPGRDRAAVAAIDPDAVQLSGDEPVEAIAAVGRPVWKVLHLPSAGARPRAAAAAAAAAAGAAAGPADAGSVAAQAIEAGRAYLAAGAERLILDTAGGPFPGGTGRLVDRAVAAAVARELPVILAGGLEPANVAEAVLAVSAIGVDVASGVDENSSDRAARARRAPRGSRPRKDPLRVALFVKRARAARFDRPHVRVRPDAGARGAARTRRARPLGLDRDFGGRYVPETLVAALDQLEAAWAETRHDPRFWAELRELQFHYGGRPTPIYRADRLGAEVARGGAPAGRANGGAAAADRLPDRIRLYLKREDLNHTGAHKLNNALGQVLLTRRLGKSRVIAETGAGHARRGHGHGLRAAGDPVRRPHGRRGHPAPGAQRAADGGPGRRGPAGPRRFGDPEGRRQRGAARLGHQRRDLALLPGLDDGPAPVPDDRARLPARHRRRGGGPAARGRRAAARPGDRLRRRRLERPRPAQSVHRRAGRPAGGGRGGGGGDRDRAARGGAPRRHAGDPPRLALLHAPGPRRPGHRGGLDLGRARLPGHRPAARGADGRPAG